MTQSATEIFVKLYLKHNCLWNPDHDDYRTHFRRQEAYKSLISDYSEATGIVLNEREVRNKINSVRVCYTKIVKRGLSPDGLPHTKIKWFADMHECLKGFQKKKLVDRSLCDDDEPRSTDEIQNVWITPDDSDDDEDDDKTDHHTTQTNDDYILLLKSESEEPEPAVKVKTEHVKRPFKNRKRKFNYSSNSEQGTDYMERMANSTDFTDRMAKQDEFDVFGKFIATQLRELGLEKALTVQLELHEVVRKARLENLSGK